MTGGSAAATGAAAVAAASAAEHAQRLLVGGLMIRVPPDHLTTLAGRTDALVVTGTIGSFLGKKRVYLVPHQGITFYATVGTKERLAVSAIEVPKIDKGPLNL